METQECPITKDTKLHYAPVPYFVNWLSKAMPNNAVTMSTTEPCDIFENKQISKFRENLSPCKV